jgi:hypothetical protein
MSTQTYFIKYYRESSPNLTEHTDRQASSPMEAFAKLKKQYPDVQLIEVSDRWV